MSIDNPVAVLDFQVRRSILATTRNKDTGIMSNDVKDNLKSQSTWKRGLYMLIYMVF